MSSISAELDDFYQKIGIAKNRFVCKNSKNCDEVCSNRGQRRIGPFGSGIGGKYRRSRYKSEGVPGLVFLTQGPVISKDELKRAEDTNENISKSAKDHDDFMNCPAHQESVNNPHWRSTKDHGLSILTTNGLPSINREEVAQHICNVNSVKCKTSGSRTKDPDKELFWNCQKHIISELEELQPDIIVAQGVKSRFVLEAAFKNEILTVLPSWELPSRKQGAQSDKPDICNIAYNIPLGRAGKLESRGPEVILFQFKDGHSCLMLWTYHPASRGHYYQEAKSQLVCRGSTQSYRYKEFNEEIHPLIVAEYLKLVDQRFK